MAAKLKIKSVAELGNWKFFLWARAIVELASHEIDGHRNVPSVHTQSAGVTSVCAWSRRVCRDEAT